MSKVYKSLEMAQQKLRAPKGQHNSFGNYNYRSAEDILAAAKPVMSEFGLCLTLTDDIRLVGERYYVAATATATDSESGESVSVTAWAREQSAKKGMDEAQITGSASSYARKYALSGLLAIDDTKDPDATNDHGRVDPLYSAKVRLTKAIREWSNATGNSADAAFDAIKGSDEYEETPAFFNNAAEQFEHRLAEAAGQQK